MIYAVTFFGIILGSSIVWMLIAGDWPKGTPLIIIWVVALAALFAVGYRRLYMGQSPEDKEAPSGEDDETKTGSKRK